MHHHVQVIQPVSMTRTLLSNPFRATRKIHATTAFSSTPHMVAYKALKQLQLSNFQLAVGVVFVGGPF